MRRLLALMLVVVLAVPSVASADTDPYPTTVAPDELVWIGDVPFGPLICYAARHGFTCGTPSQDVAYHQPTKSTWCPREWLVWAGTDEPYILGCFDESHEVYGDRDSELRFLHGFRVTVEVTS